MPEFEFQPLGGGPFVKRKEMIPAGRQVLPASTTQLGGNPVHFIVKNVEGQTLPRGSCVGIGAPLVTEANEYKADWKFNSAAPSTQLFAILSRDLGTNEVDPEAVNAGGTWALLSGETGKDWCAPSSDYTMLTGSLRVARVVDDPGPDGEVRLGKIRLMPNTVSDYVYNDICACEPGYAAVASDHLPFGLPYQFQFTPSGDMQDQGLAITPPGGPILTYDDGSTAGNPVWVSQDFTRTCYGGSDTYRFRAQTYTTEKVKVFLEIQGSQTCSDVLDWVWVPAFPHAFRSHMSNPFLFLEEESAAPLPKGCNWCLKPYSARSGCGVFTLPEVISTTVYPHDSGAGTRCPIDGIFTRYVPLGSDDDFCYYQGPVIGTNLGSDIYAGLTFDFYNSGGTITYRCTAYVWDGAAGSTGVYRLESSTPSTFSNFPLTLPWWTGSATYSCGGSWHNFPSSLTLYAA